MGRVERVVCSPQDATHLAKSFEETRGVTRNSTTFDLNRVRSLAAVSYARLMLLAGLVTLCACGQTSQPTAEVDSQLTVVAASPRDESTEDPASVTDRDYELHPALKDRRYDATIRDVVAREDPVVDGWKSERFTELAVKQLKKVGQALSASDLEDFDAASLCSDSFASNAWRPAKLQTAHEGNLFTVLRPNQPRDSSVVFRGRNGFVDALKSQRRAFGKQRESHFKFKIIRVKLDGDTATTRAYFQMTAESAEPNQRVQVNSTWDCAWSLDAQQPVLRGIRVANYEEVRSRVSSVFAFSDCTKAVFAGLSTLQDQLIYGRDHWYSNLEATIGVEGRGNGIAIGDINGDGLEDLYLCQPAALPNRLFARQSDGSLKDVSADAGVDWLDSTRAALLVDMDNDGDQDLLMTHSSTLVVQENDGTGTFQVRRTLMSNSRLFSMNAVDFDNDQDLDIFLCGYSGASQTRPEDIFASPVPYHDANNGAPNHLLRNDGNWTFTDVTRQVGLDRNNLRFSLASAWEDFDNDGDLDLYVANDFGRNNLYRNDADGESRQQRFVDIAASAGVEDIGPGMSASWGDANNDGFMDLYVSNMFSSAGSRITRQEQFKPSAAVGDIEGFRRHARGNSLFLNQADGKFADRAVQSGTVMGRWAWGSLFVDLNNDGWRDVYVTNGFVTADNNNDL